MKKTILLIFIFSTCLLFSQNITFEALDNPNDDGSAILLKWDIQNITTFKIIIERRDDGGDVILIQETDKSVGEYVDGNNISPGIEYSYSLIAYDENEEIIETVSSIIYAKAQWFNTNKISLLIMTLIITSAILYYIYSAKSGKELYIRKIAGLESIDESVGRATEMGRPILFIPGILDLDDMQTIAGLTILGKVAQKAAEYDAELIVPVCRSMVLSTAKEVVKEAYLKAGRPDAYKPDSVFYLTDDQFGYVAGVDGIIIREKPAANFFLGAFYAESLILAETGFASGAIQTA
ncbi:MAG: hypothetical protein KAT74_01525, partial [Candidatus Cloacimonetes bacterium]|nr:hypothetical protein [Candidatus Cloacimonadota bacterium]